MKILMLLVFVCSCSIAQQGFVMEPTTLYKRDIIITVNGKTAEGVIVVPKAEKYDFKVEGRGQLDFFSMVTCHQEATKERAWNVQTQVRTGPFGWGKKTIDVPNMVTFTFNPTEIEKSDCSMELSAVEKEKGRNSYGYVDFEDSVHKIQGTLECNGETVQANGVAVCQVKKGLTARVSFQEDMSVSASNPCGIKKTDPKKFEFKATGGKCVVEFGTVRSPTEWFKLTVIGYDGILLRGE